VGKKSAVTVLVVDDDAMIGTFLADMLVDMGYEVCAVAATEEDAVAQQPGSTRTC
jgi:DNA-binding response OmpR family regulator